ncbi:hypothetical protein K435DRAFT_192626 [Dendrothele bispora CBS 962.96]|uniref:Uncharacterized protein n=1 Tax=Dendrothele bispora (strain CBS 962.96) TaxID=1314807 RepID=A0A4S8LVK6_DENBC|nr:hypothetical protein K435DRAFT_192626 [Dendrothele bispora CBS 962.96]
MILSSPLDYPFIYNSPSTPTDTVPQRRASVEFLQKREEDRRVENWVKSQVVSHAFMLTAAQAYAQAQSATKTKSHSSKGHRRKRPFSSSSNRKSRNPDVFYEQLQLSYNQCGEAHLSTISELEEDVELEPYIFYSTPLPMTTSSSPIDSPISISSPIPSSISIPLATPKPMYPYSFTPSPPETPSPPASPSTTCTASTATPWNNTKQHRRKSSCSSLSSSLSSSSLESIPEEE